jgi:hypothetical protein
VEELSTRVHRSYLFSGASAFEATETETSCRPNILRMRSRQFVSKRCCPRWWNFMISGEKSFRLRGPAKIETPTRDFEPFQGQQDNCRDSFRGDFPVSDDVDLIYRWGRHGRLFLCSWSKIINPCSLPGRETRSYETTFQAENRSDCSAAADSSSQIRWPTKV